MKEDQLLSEILAAIKSLSSEVINLKDQIRSDLNQIRSDLNQSNLIRSDQIGSDQISNSRSSFSDDWKPDFIHACDSFSVDYENVDWVKIESGARYFLMNHKKILSKKGYLAKIVASNQKTEAPGQPPTLKPNQQTNHQEEKNIMGIDQLLVEKAIPNYTQEIHDLLSTTFTSSEKKFFESFAKCRSNPMKLRILVAKAIKADMISIG